MKQKITLEFRAKKTLVVDGPVSIADLKAMIPELLPDGWGLFDARMTGEPYRPERGQEACGCGEPAAPGVHKTDGPCFPESTEVVLKPCQCAACNGQDIF